MLITEQCNSNTWTADTMQRASTDVSVRKPHNPPDPRCQDLASYVVSVGTSDVRRTRSS